MRQSTHNMHPHSKNKADVLHRSTAKKTPFFFSEQNFFSPRHFRVQPKLTVNAPNDIYEKEADAVADQVMRMPDPQIQRQEEEEEEMLQMKEQVPAIQRKCAACEVEESLQRQPEEEEEEEVMLKPKPAMVQHKCAECEAEEKLQRKPLAGNITPFFQRKEVGGREVNKQAAASLQSTKGGGKSLPEHTRSWMESRFGTDFSHVSVHTDFKAVQLSRDLNAQAFTHGSDIYFNQGEFSPGTKEGKRLLAHELTHVVQQNPQKTIINRKKLTEEEKLEDLQSDFLKDSARLQTAFDNSPVMKYGEKGNEGVETLQRALKELGYPMSVSFAKTGDADGIFLGETYRTVRQFQIDSELTMIDGIAGRETIRALDSKFLSSQGPDECNINYAGDTFDKKQREEFIERHFSISDRPMARKIVADLCTVEQDQLSFASEEELRREVLKRLVTGKLMKSSQTTGAFGYPESSKHCPGHVGHALQDARVNLAARDYWNGPILESRSFIKARHYYFELTPKGKENAYEAIDLLFTPQTDICDRTLIHCDSLITLLHTLAYADAIGKDIFNEKVKNNMLGISLTFDGMSAIEGDKTPTAVSESLQYFRPSSENDLLIGDHVIFWNHLAYDAISVKNPGPWRLENAILVDKNSAGQDLYEGHGAPTLNNSVQPGPKEVMHKELMEVYNQYVKVAIPLTQKTDEGDPAAQKELNEKFPQVEKKKDQKWYINELDDEAHKHRKIRLYLLRKLTDPNDPELIGLRDPDDPTKMNRVRRPVEST